uniref:Uncharacterized protein n=1 Tax=Cannabis sativa TaxID=3483 RepID=A0A803PYR3_CANSA
MAKTVVDGDPTEATKHPAKKTKRNEMYVDENLINEGQEEGPEDEDDGKEKDDERYYYEPDPAVIEMAKELAETKLKLVAQEEFSPQMQATLARLTTRKPSFTGAIGQLR